MTKFILLTVYTYCYYLYLIIKLYTLQQKFLTDNLFDILTLVLLCHFLIIRCFFFQFFGQKPKKKYVFIIVLNKRKQNAQLEFIN